MKDTTDPIVSDAEVFDLGQTRSLADVLAACEGELEGTSLRDTRSAFRFLGEKAGIDLSGTPARPADLRQMLTGLCAARLGISDKRLANIRSLVIRAVDRFGMRRIWITREIQLAPEWLALFDRIETREHRWALSRLAAYCTVKGIAPEDVRSETLVGLQAALEAEALSKDPVNLRKHTIAVWNMCLKQVPGWPQVKLASPFKGMPYMYPLTASPEAFRRDVADWVSRMNSPDPLDPSAPIRALRPATLERHLYDFRRLGSALVREGVLTIDQVTGFHVFFEGDNFRRALRPFLPRSPDYVLKMATLIRSVSRNRMDVTEAKRAEIDSVIKRLKPQRGRRMGEKNRTRLRQFDEEAVVRRLLEFPAAELARALRKPNSLRRAKGVERALAISLLTFFGLRIQNLRSLRLDTNLRRAGKRNFLDLTGSETKTHSELGLELPAETIALLELFLEEHRPQLPRADGPWLFPGERPGTPRSYSAMRDAVTKPLAKHAGIVLSPHLYRHIIAKIVAERAPEHLTEVSRMLGHKSVNTTYQSYLGTEGPAAARRIAALLRAATGAGEPDSSS